MEPEKKKSTRGEAIMITLFLTPFIIVGILAFTFSLYSIFKSQQSKQWKKTDATVENVFLEITRGPKGGTQEICRITYSYIVDGMRFSNNKISYGLLFDDTESITSSELMYEKLKNAKQIAVLVNPNNNAQSVIFTGLNDDIVFLLLFSLLWNGFLSIFVLLTIKSCYIKDAAMIAKFKVRRILPYTLGIALVAFVLATLDVIKIPISADIDKIEVLSYK